MTDKDPTPAWAVEILLEVRQIRTELSAHSEWANRNIRDHETRLRTLEQFRWILVGVALASGGVGAMIANSFGA